MNLEILAGVAYQSHGAQHTSQALLIPHYGCTNLTKKKIVGTDEMNQQNGHFCSTYCCLIVFLLRTAGVETLKG